MIRSARRPRSFVLIAVLVVGTSALLVATGLVFIAHAEVAGQASGAAASQSRALAWSALQAIMVRLDEQRERILDGEPPRLDEEYVLYETAGRTGLARLLPMGPSRDVLAAEAGKLDLNAMDAEMLVETGLVDARLAEAIVAHRDGTLGGSFQSIGALLEVPGMRPEILYGPVEDLTLMDQARGAEEGLTGRVAERLAADVPDGLADVVTVYAFEPSLQRSGRLRINLNVPWSEELGRRVDDRFGEGASQMLKGIFDQGTKFTNDGEICRVLNTLGAEAEGWPDILDALATEPGEYLFGRLDINSAPLEALRAIPGIDSEAAAAIVRARDALSPEDRATIVWPLLEGILEAEAYETLAGRITTRCWTYRVRVAAGEIRDDAPPGAESALENPVIYEAVIDLSAPRPRVAYLRDVTLLQTTALLAANASLATAIGTRDEEDGRYDDAGDSMPGAGADGGDGPSWRDDRTGDGPSWREGRDGDGPSWREGRDGDGPSWREDEEGGGGFVAGPDRADQEVDGDDPGPATMSGSGGDDETASPGPADAGSRRRIGRWLGGR